MSSIHPDKAHFWTPVNDVDADKVEALAVSMRENGWQGRPLAGLETNGGNYLFTGSHRLAAAVIARIEVPVELMPDDEITSDQWDAFMSADDDEKAGLAFEFFGECDFSNLMQAEADANWSQK